jgi:signal transduction histidine kinase
MMATNCTKSETSSLKSRASDDTAIDKGPGASTDDLLAALSHEFRTPLNAICGWANLLRSGQVEASHMPRALEVIERNAVKLARLVDDLIESSCAFAGRLHLETSVVDMRRLLEATVAAAMQEAMMKGLELQADISCADAKVLGDAARLERMLLNLIGNAIKFTPSPGHIKVSLNKCSDDSVTLSCADTGVGIPQELLPYVFDRFCQGEGGLSRRQGGLGLGLALVKRFAELHGGAVSVGSDGPGQGAVFTVTLPLASVT